jgi:ACS family hexuronate transporter-like MFS transporter
VNVIASKWQLCILLFLATVLNYLDRQTISVLAPTLQAEMHLDNAALGWIFSAFYYAYTFCLFAAGMILDRVQLRWAYGVAVLAWSAVSALTGLANGFGALLVFRLLLAAAEAANWPGAIRIVSLAFEPRERALANGIFTSGSSVGALVAPMLILGISVAWGWRWAFAGVGSLGLMWWGCWVFFTRDKDLRSVWGNTAPVQRLGLFAGAGSIVKSPNFIPVLVISMLVNPSLYFSVNWLPTYFSQQRHVGMGKQMGWILTAIYVGIDLGSIAAGAGILALTKRGFKLPAARRTMFLLATAAVAGCAAVPVLTTLGDAVAVLISVNFGLGIWTATYLTMAQDVSPTNPSTSLGILSGCGSLAGALFMAAVGKITQATGSFAIPMATVTAAAIIAAVAGWFVETPSTISAAESERVPA